MTATAGRRRWPSTAACLAGVIAIGLSARLVVVLFIEAPPERFEYHAIVENILAGRGLVYEFLGVPYRAFYQGLPYLGIYATLWGAFPGHAESIVAAQSFFSMANAAVIFWLGRRAGGRSVGLLAALGTALHPALLYCDARKLHPLAIDSLLTSSVAASLVWTRDRPSWKRGAITGVVLGLAILQRGTLAPVLPLAGIWLWRGGRGVARRVVGAYVAMCVLTLCPWLIRNQLLLGRPVLASISGHHFWLGNAPGSLGSSLLATGEPVIHRLPSSLSADLMGKSELEQNDAFWRAGLALVTANPPRFFIGVATKLFRFWTIGPRSGASYPPTFRALYVSYYALVVILATMGAWRIRRAPFRRHAVTICALAFLAVSGTHALFYAELRHRWALEPLMLVLASIGLRPALIHIRPWLAASNQQR